MTSLERDILEAHERGDTVTLERLQRQYRNQNPGITRYTDETPRLITGSAARVNSSAAAVGGGSVVGELPKFYPELEPSYQVSISAGAMRTIREEIRANGRYSETGGWLFGGSNSIVFATGPGEDGGSVGRSKVLLGFGAWDLVRDLAPHLTPIGDWHVHTSGTTTNPSDTDRRAWQRGCELNGSHWLGLIFAPARDMWSQPECASYITTGVERAAFCEPLRLVEF